MKGPERRKGGDENWVTMSEHLRCAIRVWEAIGFGRGTLFRDEGICDDILIIGTMLAAQGSPDKGCGLHTAGPALTNIIDLTVKWGGEGMR